MTLFWNCKESTKEDFKINYPKEELGVIKATYSDGSLAIGGFNRGYKNYEEKSNYPWSLKITMELDKKNCNPNGLPMDSESKLVNQIEDELVEKMLKISPIHNVGHLFNSNQLDIYLYIRDKKKIDTWLQLERKKENVQRSFSYEINKDRNWSLIENFM